MPRDTSRNDRNFQGSGYKYPDKKEYILQHDISFGGKSIKAGTLVKQFETRDFGWTSWIDENGNHKLTRE